MDLSAGSSGTSSSSQSQREVTIQRIKTALENDPSFPTSALSPRSLHHLVIVVLDHLTIEKHGPDQKEESSGIKGPTAAIHVKPLEPGYTLQSLAKFVEELRLKIEEQSSKIEEQSSKIEEQSLQLEEIPELRLKIDNLLKELNGQQAESKALGHRLSITIRSVDAVVCRSALHHGALYELGAIELITRHIRTLQIRRNSLSHKLMGKKNKPAGATEGGGVESEYKTSKKVIEDFLTETGLDTTDSQKSTFNASLKEIDFGIFTIFTAERTRIRKIVNDLLTKKSELRNEIAHPKDPSLILYHLFLLERWEGAPFAKELQRADFVSQFVSQHDNLARYCILIHFVFLCLSPEKRQTIFIDLCESQEFFPMKRWQIRLHSGVVGYVPVDTKPWLSWADED